MRRALASTSRVHARTIFSIRARNIAHSPARPIHIRNMVYSNCQPFISHVIAMHVCSNRGQRTRSLRALRARKCSTKGVKDVCYNMLRPFVRVHYVPCLWCTGGPRRGRSRLAASAAAHVHACAHIGRIRINYTDGKNRVEFVLHMLHMRRRWRGRLCAENCTYTDARFARTALRSLRGCFVWRAPGGKPVFSRTRRERAATVMEVNTNAVRKAVGELLGAAYRIAAAWARAMNCS